MISLKEIASTLDIETLQSDIQISSMNDLKHADQNQLSFYMESAPLSDLQNTKAKAVIVHQDAINDVPRNTLALSVKGDVQLALAKVSKLFYKSDFDLESKEIQIGKNCEIAKNVYIGSRAKIGDNVTLMSGVSIGPDAIVEEGSTIFPNVTIYRDCSVGKNCIIHANSVIGSDGFGFAHTALGEHVKIYQNGNVVLEDNVEIGSNCSIDRAVFNTTLIKHGTKLDNLVHIAHNCEIGEHSLITASVIIAGSTKIGRNFVAAGQAGVNGHIEIAPFTTLSAKAGVVSSIKESGTTVGGFPHLPQKQWLRLQAKLMRLLKGK